MSEPGMTISALQSASSKDLIDELVNRHDFACFIGMKIPEKESGLSLIMRRWVGNSHTCAGLCVDLGNTILAEYAKREEDVSTEDG